MHPRWRPKVINTIKRFTRIQINRNQMDRNQFDGNCGRSRRREQFLATSYVFTLRYIENSLTYTAEARCTWVWKENVY